MNEILKIQYIAGKYAFLFFLIRAHYSQSCLEIPVVENRKTSNDANTLRSVRCSHVTPYSHFTLVSSTTSLIFSKTLGKTATSY